MSGTGAGRPGGNENLRQQKKDARLPCGRSVGPPQGNGPAAVIRPATEHDWGKKT